MKIEAFLMSCPDRAVVCAATVASFRRTDWSGELTQIMDDGASGDRVRGITVTWRRLLERALEGKGDFFLLMEDDLEVNVHLAHNLRHWAPLQGLGGNRVFFGSLYNVQRNYFVRDDARNFLIADPSGFWGSQAIVVSRALAAYLVSCWEEGCAADIQLSRLAARVGPLYQHTPSLVQHTGMVSTWGGIQHTAADFDPSFCSGVPVPADADVRAAVAW